MFKTFVDSSYGDNWRTAGPHGQLWDDHYNDLQNNEQFAAGPWSSLDRDFTLYPLILVLCFALCAAGGREQQHGHRLLKACSLLPVALRPTHFETYVKMLIAIGLVVMAPQEEICWYPNKKPSTHWGFHVIWAGKYCGEAAAAGGCCARLVPFFCVHEI